MNNKSIFYFLLIAFVSATQFSSCTKEQVVDRPAGNEKIVIGLSDGTVTRGTLIGDNSLLADKPVGLHVFHNRPSETTKMLDQFTTLDGKTTIAGKVSATVETDAAIGAYDYGISLAPGQYWPAKKNSNETLEFFAWYPHTHANLTVTEGTVSDAAGEITMDYTVPQYNGDQIDLLASISKPGTANWGKYVTMHFHHTLAQVTVSFEKATATVPDFSVKSIELQGINIQGTLSVAGTAYVANTLPGFTWTPISTGTLKYTSAAATGLACTGTATTAVTSSPFLTLPMTFPASNTAAKLKIVFDDASGLDPVDATLSALENTKPWEAGKHVNYRITVEENANGFTVSQVDWDVDPTLTGGDIVGRKLNVSTTEVTVAAGGTYRLYFWSNQPTVQVESNGYTGASGTSTFAVSTAFTNLSASYTYNSGSGTGTGYIDIKPSGTGSTTTRRIILNAGGLRKEIKIVSP